MGVNLIFKIAAVGILVSVLCQVLKHSGREDQAFLTSLAGLVLVLFWIVPYIYELFETINLNAYHPYSIPDILRMKNFDVTMTIKQVMTM